MISDFEAVKPVKKQFFTLAMTSLLVSPASTAELNLITAMLKKMNIAAKVLSDEEKEDLGLAFMMRQAAGEPKVSRDEVMRKLSRAWKPNLTAPF